MFDVYPVIWQVITSHNWQFPDESLSECVRDKAANPPSPHPHPRRANIYLLLHWLALEHTHTPFIWNVVSHFKKFDD